MELGGGDTVVGLVGSVLLYIYTVVPATHFNIFFAPKCFFFFFFTIPGIEERRCQLTIFYARNIYHIYLYGCNFC